MPANMRNFQTFFRTVMLTAYNALLLCSKPIICFQYFASKTCQINLAGPLAKKASQWYRLQRVIGGLQHDSKNYMEHFLEYHLSLTVPTCRD